MEDSVDIRFCSKSSLQYRLHWLSRSALSLIIVQRTHIDARICLGKNPGQQSTCVIIDSSLTFSQLRVEVT